MTDTEKMQVIMHEGEMFARAIEALAEDNGISKPAMHMAVTFLAKTFEVSPDMPLYLECVANWERVFTQNKVGNPKQ